jgi:hypothetical protein
MSQRKARLTKEEKFIQDEAMRSAKHFRFSSGRGVDAWIAVENSNVADIEEIGRCSRQEAIRWKMWQSGWMPWWFILPFVGAGIVIAAAYAMTPLSAYRASL